jgi:hypothetical protein
VGWEIGDRRQAPDARHESTAHAVFFAAKRLWTAQRQLRFSLSPLPGAIFNDLNGLNDLNL